MRWQAVVGWSLAVATASGAVVAVCCAVTSVREVITPKHGVDDGGEDSGTVLFPVCPV